MTAFFPFYAMPNPVAGTRCENVITHVKIPTPGAKRVGKRVLGARIIASSIARAVLEHGAWEPLGS